MPPGSGRLLGVAVLVSRDSTPPPPMRTVALSSSVTLLPSSSSAVAVTVSVSEVPSLPATKAVNSQV